MPYHKHDLEGVRSSKGPHGPREVAKRKATSVDVEIRAIQALNSSEKISSITASIYSAVSVKINLIVKI